LKVGDQKGGQRAVLEVSGNLKDIPYPLEWSQFPNAAPLLEAIAAGAVDTGMGGDAAFIFATGSGAPIKAIGGYRTTGMGTVVVVRGDSPIRDFTDLPGKRFATPRGSVGHNYLLAAMERLGRPYDAIRFSFLGPSEGRAALQAGSVDGWAMWDPYVAIAQQTDGCRIIKGPSDLVPGCGFQFVRTGAIVPKRAALKDFQDRLYRGRSWANQHLDAYAATMSKETGIPLDILRISSGRSRLTPLVIEDQLIAAQQKIADRYVAIGLLPKQIDVANAFDASFTRADPRPV
jgi:sulfonate transport system substrate-binding protein